MKKCWIIMLVAVIAVMAGCGQISDEAKSAATGAEMNTVSENDTVKSLGMLPETDTGRSNVTDKRAAISTPVEVSQINSENSKQDTVSKKSQVESKVNANSAVSSHIPSENSAQVTGDSNQNTVPMSSEDANAVGSNNEFNIFEKLNLLNYKPITCDGLPEYELIAPDGTVYSINLTDKWVWNSRKNNMEATLPDELVSWLNKNGESVGLKVSEYAPIDNESQRETSLPTNTSETNNDFNIFEELNSLDYKAITCDGLPEYELIAPDGTVYSINLTDKWVWSSKKGDMEATLPDELVSWLNKNGESVGVKIL